MSKTWLLRLTIGAWALPVLFYAAGYAGLLGLIGNIHALLLMVGCFVAGAVLGAVAIRRNALGAVALAAVALNLYLLWTLFAGLAAL